MRSKLLLWVLCLCTTSIFADNVTFCVDMNCNPNNFTQPYISGNFNEWCGDCNALTDQGNNVWCGTININEPIEYKFTFDNWTGQENFNPGSSCTVTNFGFTNRFYAPEGDATVNYAWNSCDAACPTLYDVEFCVDLSCIDGLYTQPYISGNFNGWCGDCDPLSDQGGGMYCRTLSLLEGAQVEYKFTLDNWTRQEEFMQGDFCTVSAFGFTNRFHYVNSNTTLMYGWNSCDVECVPYNNVEFCLDTDCMPEAYGQLYVSGEFNGWCGDCNPLTDQGNGDHCTTLLLPSREFEFKFTRDNWAGQEFFIGGEPCTVSSFGFTNRVVDVDGDMSYKAAWGYCAEDCDDLQGGNVEFCVCTEDVDFAFNQVYISGNFNGWCGDCNPLTPQGGGQWCTTLPLNHGQIHYKFTMDNWANQEFFTPGDPCTFTAGPFVNRALYVDGDASVSYVWEKCVSGGLPDGIDNGDLGTALVPGSVNGGLCSGLGDNSYEIVSSGIGNSFNSDNQHILHQELCGDGEVFAYIAGISPAGWGGVGMRENTAAGAKKAELASNGSNFIQRRVRTMTNSWAIPQQLFRPNHKWLKVVRQGDYFSGYTSQNGSQWFFAFSQKIVMGNCIEVYAFSQALNVALSPATATVNDFTVYNSNGNLTTQGGSIVEQGTAFLDSGLSVYPNPASDLLKVESMGLDCEDCQVSLINSLGQRVALLTESLVPGSYIELDVSNFESGIYLIQVEGADQQFTRKVVIQK